METVITGTSFLKQLLRERRESRVDRLDEVWDGVYVVSPDLDNDHQHIRGSIFLAFDMAVELAGLGEVRIGGYVSDRTEKWRRNYRTPDGLTVLNGGSAIKKDSHWLGGPDFIVEIVSQHDRSRKKIEFYSRVGVRELLLVDRYPWSLELYRLFDGVLSLVGKSDLSNPSVITSELVPLSFQLVAGEPRPRIEIRHADGVQRWSA